MDQADRLIADPKDDLQPGAAAITESRYATLSEVKLHYLEDGEGDVVVLLRVRLDRMR